MPTITKVTVSASSGFNHPHEQFSNFKPFVSLEAELNEGDDYYQVAKELQARAETLVQSHKEEILEDLERIERIEQAKRDLEFAKQQHQRYQDNADVVAQREKDLAELLDEQAGQHLITQGAIISEVSGDDDLEELTGMAAESDAAFDCDMDNPPY